MGLGPPVCLVCDRIMNYHQGGPVWWKCSVCGKVPGDRETTNLFCLTQYQAASLLEKQDKERDKPSLDDGRP